MVSWKRDHSHTTAGGERDRIVQERVCALHVRMGLSPVREVPHVVQLWVDVLPARVGSGDESAGRRDVVGDRRAGATDLHISYYFVGVAARIQGSHDRGPGGGVKRAPPRGTDTTLERGSTGPRAVVPPSRDATRAR
jgi:hypothetical protein